MQPLAAVTVTVYVPGLFTENVAFVLTTAEPLDQEYVPPPVAVRRIEVVVHVRMEVTGGVIATTGEAMF